MPHINKKVTKNNGSLHGSLSKIFSVYSAESFD